MRNVKSTPLGVMIFRNRDRPVGQASMQNSDRLAALIATETKADELFAAIEENGLIAPGRTERMIDEDIYALAEQSFGVTQHWHRRIVRAGPNARCVFPASIRQCARSPQMTACFSI